MDWMLTGLPPIATGPTRTLRVFRLGQRPLVSMAALWVGARQAVKARGDGDPSTMLALRFARGDLEHGREVGVALSESEGDRCDGEAGVIDNWC
jgi:hypothetical protein